MSGYDPLSANGILYASPHDIIMSDEPVYFARPFQPQVIKGEPKDSFSLQNEPKKSSLKKWAVGIAATALAIFGIKKFGTKSIKNFLQNHPKLANLKTTVVDFCKKLNPFKKKP